MAGCFPPQRPKAMASFPWTARTISWYSSSSFCLSVLPSALSAVFGARLQRSNTFWTFSPSAVKCLTTETTWIFNEYFLRALRKYYGGALAFRVWDHSEGFSVEIGEPLETKAGKILPLHLSRWSAERR